MKDEENTRQDCFAVISNALLGAVALSACNSLR